MHCKIMNNNVVISCAFRHYLIVKCVVIFKLDFTVFPHITSIKSYIWKE